MKTYLLGSRISLIDYGPDPNKKCDEELSIDSMKFINEMLRKNFMIKETLDERPVGGNTPAQPEALFIDSEAKFDVVIELKTFDYSSVPIFHKVKKINNYCTQLLKEKTEFELKDNIFVFVFELYNDNFNPNAYIRNLQGKDLFTNAYRDKNALLKVIKIKKGASLKKLNLSYNTFQREHPNELGEFRYMYSKPIDSYIAIQIANDYSRFAKQLRDVWLGENFEKDRSWNKKFVSHSDKFKVLFIDFNMKSECGYAYMHGLFDPFEFVKFFVSHYSSDVTLHLITMTCFRFEQRVITVHETDGEYVFMSHPDGKSERYNIQSSSNAFII